MIQEIYIEGFKAIKDRPLVLKDLAKINYLVGENGSGKSSIIEFLMGCLTGFFQDSTNSILCRTYGDLNKIIYPLSKCKITNDNNFYSLAKINIESSQKISKTHEATMNTQIATFSTLPLNFDQSLYDYFIPYKQDFDSINEIEPHEIRTFLNKYIFSTKKISRIYSSISFEKSILLEFENDEDNLVNLKSLSSGQLQLLTFYRNILAKAKIFNNVNPNEAMICLEEPENHFHPKYQKLIPYILNDICEQYPKVTFIIATHSVFMISEDKNAKVYLIKDGSTVNEKGEFGKGENGFSGKGISYVVADMLGSDQTDLGYPENFCVVEESSICTLLNRLKDKGILKDWQFISSRGNGDSHKYVDRINNLKIDYDLFICNIFYKDKFCLILDKVKENTCDWYKKTKSRLKDRFIELSQSQLEDYYPKELKQEYENECKNSNNNKGKTKDDFAQKAADSINSPKEFSEFFNGELDFLLAN